MFADKRFLVVGGTGYLGSHVANLLGERCMVFDSLLYTNEYLKDVEFVFGDVNDHALLKSLLDRASTLVSAGDASCTTTLEDRRHVR